MHFTILNFKTEKCGSPIYIGRRNNSIIIRILFIRHRSKPQRN